MRRKRFEGLEESEKKTFEKQSEKNSVIDDVDETGRKRDGRNN
jgi:hypothetical protein